MGLKDLENKRTGRPRGAKSSSRVKRDLDWAYRNLGKPEAEPPSVGAGMLAEFARRQPDKFLDSVLRVLAWEEERGRAADGNAESVRRSDQPARVQTLFVSRQDLVAYFTGRGAPWVWDLPTDARVISCVVSQARQGVEFTIYSEMFEEVAEAEGIPPLTGQYLNHAR